jgi:hypothetical protein
MSETRSRARSTSAIEGKMNDARRTLYENASDGTDLGDVIRCLRMIVGELCAPKELDHAILLRALGTLCTAANLQERLHGGERTSDQALHDAAEALLTHHTGERP